MNTAATITTTPPVKWAEDSGKMKSTLLAQCKEWQSSTRTTRHSTSYWAAVQRWLCTTTTNHHQLLCANEQPCCVSHTSSCVFCAFTTPGRSILCRNKHNDHCWLPPRQHNTPNNTHQSRQTTFCCHKQSCALVAIDRDKAY